MKKKAKLDSEVAACSHKNIKKDSGFFVCQDCGLIMEESLAFEETVPTRDFFIDSQRDYERKIRVSNSKALQDPVIKEKYDRIKTLEKWFRDYESDFAEQKKTIELLKSHGIGLNINNVRYKEIKDRYLKYNKYHRHNYQNMVIIFLAIVWMEIKDTTNIRIEEFIKVSKELGHKVNKKMITNAMLKVKRTENMLKSKKSTLDIEKEIKSRIKLVFQKDLNNIPYKKVQEFFKDKVEYEKIKVGMLLLADRILKKISYSQIQSLNYKAFTAGLIYYVGQTLENRKIFTQSLIESVSKFSSTTIRKRYHVLKNLLGDPQALKL
ncbi:MAG: TFIIB-type zinc ribbon-containing protein [Promethearchaeota archaeon]|nr:MAG: TFIIB-type zinc ribbon-containing protein [Candidatus Lokiarchaeota archaeon]